MAKKKKKKKKKKKEKKKKKKKKRAIIKPLYVTSLDKFFHGVNNIHLMYDPEGNSCFHWQHFSLHVHVHVLLSPVALPLFWSFDVSAVSATISDTFSKSSKSPRNLGTWGSRDTLSFTCFCKFYLFLFPALIKVSVLYLGAIVSGKLIELASSTIGQRAKRVLGHRAKLGQHAKSRQCSWHKAIKETEKPL